MRKQSGFAEIVTLLLYAGMVAAVLGIAWKAWDGFKHSIAAPYVAAQMKADQALIDTANSDRDAAEARATSAAKDLEGVKSASAEQTKALREAEAQALTAQAAARTAGIKYAAEVAKHADRITALAKLAGQPPVAGQSCEAVLRAADAILRDSQRLVNGPK